MKTKLLYYKYIYMNNFKSNIKITPKKNVRIRRGNIFFLNIYKICNF